MITITIQTNQSYHLECLECLKIHKDDYTLFCDNGCKALLRTKYRDQKLEIKDKSGLFKYENWLPVSGSYDVVSKPVTYKSHELAQYLGLDQLYISFNGFWPEKGAYTVTGSFKEYEAYPTLKRLEQTKNGIIQVSSAGNTARAFAHAAIETGNKVLLIVPETSLHRLWSIYPDHNNVFLIAVDGDYYDAISIGKDLVDMHSDIFPEGGARNVARRDGMGLVMVDAVHTMGRLPDFYFQGIGSGTGGIANYEMALKLQKDGRFGDKIPKLMLVQNYPFVPMFNAWNAGRSDIIENEDMPNAEVNISKVIADLLTNRQPPYSIPGGVHEIVTQSNGSITAVTNKETKESMRLFLELEGNDIDPAAGVALASLRKHVENHKIPENKSVLLNISGGGYQKVETKYTKYQIKPNTVLENEPSKAELETILDHINEFKN